MRQGVKTELKEGKLCGMEDRGRGTLWKGMKKQTRSKQMRSESPEKLPALTGGSEALERGQKLLPSNPPTPKFVNSSICNSGVVPQILSIGSRV